MRETPELAFLDTDVADLVMHHEVDVVPQRGLATVRVPLTSPSGRGGFGPRLGLEYSSAGGNSPFGIGWSLSGLLGVSLSATRSHPRYDGSDHFAFSGAGDLVPWLRLQGAEWLRRVDDLGAFWVHYYRPTVDTQHIRMERWVEKATGREHWRTRDTENVLTVYGLGTARIADPDDDRRTYAWLPEQQYDPSGNAIVFDYVDEDLTGVSLARSSERRQVGRDSSQAQRYLKRIRYGNTRPMQADAPEPAGNRWMFQVVFDYGDHADPDSPSPAPDSAWPVRDDPYSAYGSGFEIRTYRLCRRILAFHSFPALGPAPVLVGSYRLAHDPSPQGTVLSALDFVGSRRESSGIVTRKSIPPVRFTYSQPAAASAFAPAPMEAEINVPGGLANGHRWIDLFGEGLPGILTETSHAWYFKANLGDGVFAPQQVVPSQPSYRLGRSAISDFDGDGNTKVAVLHGREAGFYEYARDDATWVGFQTIGALPHLEAAGRSAQWSDLSGDGRADLLMASDGRLTWYPSDGKGGFDRQVEVQQDIAAPADLAIREDLALDLFFADMNGDGLVDQVRVRNGRVEYWPHIGNGRFGDPIVMDGSPTFAPNGQFDSARVLLVDLDGNGAADVVYVGHGDVRYWFNAHGNALVEGGHLTGLPYVDNVSLLQVLDFRGDGTPHLVWSTTLAGRSHAIHYLPLTGGIQPRLLVGTDNSMGRQVQIEYGTSAQHYLRDKADGHPWLTRLPVHAAVVESKRIIDQIGGSRSVMRFRYHEGRFDSDERSVAGFAYVETFDSEVHDATDTTPEIVGTAPTCIRTWFNVGEPSPKDLPDRYLGDAVRAPLARSAIEDGGSLLSGETDAAARALIGLMRRQETYAASLDGIVGQHPIEVVQTAYRVKRIQPKSDDDDASFTYFLSERLIDLYEQQPDDPRSTHELTLDVDEYGLPTLTASTAYPRRAGQPIEMPAQQRLLMGAAKMRHLTIDTAARYEVGIPVEEYEYELAGFAPGPSGVFPWDDLRAGVSAAIASPAAFDEPLSGVSPGARLIGWDRARYWNDARTAQRPLGQVGSPTLLHHEESACFTPASIADAFAGRVDAAMLETDGGYRLDDGYWWQTGPTYHFGDPATFNRVDTITRSDGGVTELAYDTDEIALVGIVDGMGNRSKARIDYYVVAPDRITDPNDAVAEVAYDPLSVVVVSTAQWRSIDGAAARLHGQALLDQHVHRTAPTLDALAVDPAFYVQDAAEYVVYGLDSWVTAATPPWLARVFRQELRHDGKGGGSTTSVAQVGVSYYDGLRRTVQAKTLVEPGPAIQRDAAGNLVRDPAGNPIEARAEIRWLVSGHAVHNLKQQPIRQFEPFFTDRVAYEPEIELAQIGSPRDMRYDAVGRLIREEVPNGTFSSTAIGAWRILDADPNDNVMDSMYRVVRDSLPDGHPEKDALRKAEQHADTPLVSELDPLGRECRRVERGVPQDRVTDITLDHDGRATRIADPRGLSAFEYLTDMLGRPNRTKSADAGTSWTLFDIFDRPIHQWHDRGVHQRRVFDVLDRLTRVFVDGALGLSHMTEQLVYGEDPSIGQAKARNLRGRLATHHDQAGIRRYLQYDAAGNVVRTERQLRSGVTGEPDWTDPATVSLDIQKFVTEVSFDGLGRLRVQSLPDGTRRSHHYLNSGPLNRVEVASADGKVMASILESAEFNARGQLTSARMANGIRIEHEHDRETFRTTRIAARRTSTPFGWLQDLRYTYDPVGNVTRSTDLTQQQGAAAPALQGLQVSSEQDFTYDSFYQLSRATGRIHQALLEHDYRPGVIGPGATKGTRHLTFSNGAAVERYAQTYLYDPSGNLRQIRHVGSTHSWTTDFWISPTSNRSVPARDPLGNSVVNPEGNFDAAGNTLSLAHVRKLDWNYRSSLARAVIVDRSASGQPDDAEYYTYDADGRRVRKVTDRLTAAGIERTEVLYFEACEITRVSQAGNLILERFTSHVHDSFGRIAIVDRWDLDDAARESDDVSLARVRYELTNHLGSAQLTLDHGGAVVSYEEYLPYGGTAFVVGDDLREVARRDYRYCGKESDAATGLYYFEYRYYAPWIGRWMSPDPIGPEDDLNLYRYVHNDPVNLVDPDGLQSSVESGSLTWAPLTPQMAGFFREAYLRLSPAQQAKFRQGKIGFLVDANGDIRPASRREIRAEARRRAQAGEHVILYDGPSRPRPRPRPPAETSELGDVVTFEPLVVTAGMTEIVIGSEDEPGSGPPPSGDPDFPPQSGGDPDGGAERGSDGRDGGARGANGGGAGDGDRSTSRDGSAAGVHAADGSSMQMSPPGGGVGDGNGSGGGRSGTGRGGGGTGSVRSPGVGSGGTRGSGSGAGRGGGRGGGLGGRAGRGARPGTGGGGGTAIGNSASGGPGNGASDSDDRTGGGAAGGTGTGSGTATPSEPTATETDDGTTPGTNTGNLPPSPGGGPPPLPGQTVNGDDPNGSRSGKETGIVGGNNAGQGGQRAGGSPNGTPEGRSQGEGPPPQPGGEAGGSRRQGPPVERTIGDKIVEIAGYVNLEFEENPNGQSGGVPGGQGTHNLGAFGQALYVALTVASLFFGGALLKAGLKGGLKALLSQVAKVFTRQFWQRARTRLWSAASNFLSGLVRQRVGQRTPFLRRAFRFLLEERRTFGASRDFFARHRWLFGGPGHGWSMEHMIIKQRWYRGANPVFARGTRLNRLLQGLGDAGWNVVPLPGRLNSALYRWPKVSAVFNYGFYGATGYGQYRLWSWATEPLRDSPQPTPARNDTGQ